MPKEETVTEKTFSPISTPVVFGVIVISSLVLITILPTSNDLLKRMVEDKKFKNAENLLHHLPSSQENKHLHSFITLKVNRHNLEKEKPNQLLRPKEVVPLLKQVWQFSLLQGNKISKKALMDETAILLSHSVDLSFLKEWHQKFSSSFSNQQSQYFNKQLILESKKRGNPIPQAFIQRKEMLSSQQITLPQLIKLIQMWRASNLPSESFKDIQHFIQSTSSSKQKQLFSEASSHDILALISLFREINKNSYAFNFIRTHFDILKKKLTPETTLKLLEITARQSDRQKELLVDYQKWIKEYPTDERVLKKLASLALQLNKLSLAEYAYDQLLKQSPDNRNLLTQQAQIYEWRGKSNQAFDFYFQITKISNQKEKNFHALKQMLRLNPGLYRDQDLIHALESNLSPSKVSPYHLQLAQLQVRQAAYEKAENTYTQYLKKYSKDSAALFQLGQLQKEFGDYEHAIQTLVQLKNIQPKDLKTQKNLSELYYESGQYEKALSQLEELAFLSRNEDFIRHYLVSAYSLGYNKKTIAGLELITKLDQGYKKEDFSNLAYHYSLEKETQNSILALQRGIKHFPKDLELRLQLAYRFSDQKKYLESLHLIQPVLKNDLPLNVKQFYLQLLSSCKKYKEAIEYLEQNWEIKTEKDPALVQLAMDLYFQSKSYSKLKHLALRIYEKNPQEQNALRYLVSLALQRKKHDEAQKWIEILLEYYPDDPEGNYYLASLHMSKRQYKKAKYLLQKLKQNDAINLNSFFEYEMDLAYSAWQSGDWQQAIDSYETVITSSSYPIKYQNEASDALNEVLYPQHLPHFFFNFKAVDLASGNIFRYSTESHHRFSPSHQFSWILHRDDIYLESPDSIHRHRNEGIFRLQSHIGDEWYGSLGIGGTDEDLLFEGELKQLFPGRGYLAWRAAYNKRAIDSLNLEALDGRQDRISTFLNLSLTSSTTLNWEGYLRRVKTDSKFLGEGIGSNFNLSQQFPLSFFDLFLSYQAEVSAFSRRTDDLERVEALTLSDVSDSTSFNTLDNLISSDINRHGLALTFVKRIRPRWKFEVSPYFGYLFAQSNFGYGVTSEITYTWRKAFELRLGTAYYSSGSQSNQGSGATELNLSMRAYY